MLTTHSNVAIPSETAVGVPILVTVNDLSGEESNLFIIEAVVFNGIIPPELTQIGIYVIGTGEEIADNDAALSLVTSNQIIGNRILLVDTHLDASAKTIKTSEPLNLYNDPEGTANLIVYCKLAKALSSQITLTVRVVPYT